MLLVARWWRRQVGIRDAAEPIVLPERRCARWCHVAQPRFRMASHRNRIVAGATGPLVRARCFDARVRAAAAWAAEDVLWHLWLGLSEGPKDERPVLDGSLRVPDVRERRLVVGIPAGAAGHARTTRHAIAEGIHVAGANAADVTLEGCADRARAEHACPQRVLLAAAVATMMVRAGERAADDRADDRSVSDALHVDVTLRRWREALRQEPSSITHSIMSL